MPDLFTVVEGLFNLPVRLAEATWYLHVIVRHPEMAEHLGNVKQALAGPHVVLQSEHTRDSYLYHLRLASPPRLYVRVVVRFRRNAQDELQEGVVRTAFLTDTMSGGSAVWITRHLPIR